MVTIHLFFGCWCGDVVTRRLRPLLMRLHPWLRYVDLAMNLYDLAQSLGLTDGIFDVKPTGRQVTTGGVYGVTDACGGGGGPVLQTQGWPACGADYVVNNVPDKQFFAGKIYYWGPYSRPFGGTRAYYKPGFIMERLPGIPTTVRAGYVNAPVGPVYSPRPGITLPMVQPKTAPQIKGPTQPPPPTFQPPIHKAVPPGPGVKERKGRAAPAVAAALAAAHGFTEGVDVVDALFEALPKNLQRETKRSGRTKRGAKIGEGKPFLTPLDKAMSIYRNLAHLDLNAAALNLLKNHLEDKIIGRMNAGADSFSRRNLGGSRFVGFG